MEQGQEEMRLAQERFEREAKEGGELPLQDSKEDGTVEKGEKARLENAQKVSHKWKEIPCSSPAAITPAKPGSASSAAAQPRTEEPQRSVVRRLQLISLQVLGPLEFPSLQRRWENRPPFKALPRHLLRLHRLVGQPLRRSCTPLCSLKSK